MRKWVKTQRHGSAQCPNDGGCISRLIFPLFPLFSLPRRGVNFRPFDPFVRTCREPGGLARPTRWTCEIEMKALQSNQDASAGKDKSAGVCDRKKQWRVRQAGRQADESRQGSHVRWEGKPWLAPMWPTVYLASPRIIVRRSHS